MGVLCGIGYYYLRDKFVAIAEVSLLLLSNIYAMCILVVLMSYGIAFLPIFIWKKGRRES